MPEARRRAHVLERNRRQPMEDFQASQISG
jgi:hypothetical protein